MKPETSNAIWAAAYLHSIQQEKDPEEAVRYASARVRELYCSLPEIIATHGMDSAEARHAAGMFELAPTDVLSLLAAEDAAVTIQATTQRMIDGCGEIPAFITRARLVCVWWTTAFGKTAPVFWDQLSVCLASQNGGSLEPTIQRLASSFHADLGVDANTPPTEFEDLVYCVRRVVLELRDTALAARAEALRKGVSVG